MSEIYDLPDPKKEAENVKVLLSRLLNGETNLKDSKKELCEEILIAFGIFIEAILPLLPEIAEKTGCKNGLISIRHGAYLYDLTTDGVLTIGPDDKKRSLLYAPEAILAAEKDKKKYIDLKISETDLVTCYKEVIQYVKTILSTKTSVLKGETDKLKMLSYSLEKLRK
jgi:hypothetical protein